MKKETVRYTLYTILGVILLGGLAIATTISDTASTFTDDLTINGDLELDSGTDGIILTGDGGGVYGVDQPLLHLKPGNAQAKPDIAWDGYYDNGTDVIYKDGVGWFVCHYNTSIGSSVHQHCSFEVARNDTGTLETIFGMDYMKAPEDTFVFINRARALRLNTDVQLHTKSPLIIYPEDQTNDGLNISIYDNSPQLEAEGSTKLYLNTDLIFKSGAIDVKGVGDIDIYPYDNTAAFKVTTHDGTGTGQIQIQGSGTSVIHVGDSLRVIGELNVTGVTGAGKAVCVKADGNFGVCGDAVGAGGTCTCS